MKRIVVLVLASVLLVGAAVWLYGRLVRCRPPQLTVIDDPAEFDDRHVDLPNVDSESWVRQYLPGRSFNGFNLGLFQRRVPILFDMQGRVVHSWPRVRAVGRIRLDREGRLAVIGADHLIKEYDWNGDLTWHYQLDDVHDFPHHDLMRMENGNFLILAHDGHGHADYLLEVNREREVVWEWWFADHRGAFPNYDDESTDPTHSNSIREVPPNRWFDAGDQRFRPGNILVSSRSLSTVFIIDRISGDVVWKYSEGLDHQHEAEMIPRGHSGEGLIMVFNNGRDNLNAYRSTVVKAFDPVSGKVEWDYSSEFFYSTIGGTAQLLPNENVLITSSHGGRAFEILGNGRIVWEWTPPFKPMRLLRLAPDHCPQLAGLMPEKRTKILPEDPRPFVDGDLFGFALPEKVERRKVSGHERKLVPENRDCQDLLMPPGARLRVEYGIDRDLEWPGWLEGRFELWILDGGTKRKLVDAQLGGSADAWYRSRRWINLEDLAYREIEMCVSASVLEGDEDDLGELVWGNPVIESTTQRPPHLLTAEKISEREKRLREKQLKALGYAD